MATALTPLPSSNQAASLLTIPREIRDQIYALLRCNLNSPPPSLKEAGPRYETPAPRQSTCVTYLSSERYPQHTHLNLLLVNQHIYAEFSNYLQSSHVARRADDTILKLDCMMNLLLPNSIWPTWITFPGPISHIPTLEIDMRLFEDDSFDGDSFPRKYCPVISFPSTFALLNRLLSYGPRLNPDDPTGGPCRIGTVKFRLFMLDDPDLYTTLPDDFITFFARMQQLTRSGLLVGKVGRIVVQCGGRIQDCKVREGELNSRTSRDWARSVGLNLD